MIKVSGTVEYEKGIPIIIQLRSPSDIVAIEQSFPLPSGSFVISFVAEDPKWIEFGTYIIIIISRTESGEKLSISET